MAYGILYEILPLFCRESTWVYARYPEISRHYVVGRFDVIAKHLSLQVSSARWFTYNHGFVSAFRVFQIAFCSHAPFASVLLPCMFQPYTCGVHMHCQRTLLGNFGTQIHLPICCPEIFLISPYHGYCIYIVYCIQIL